MCYITKSAVRAKFLHNFRLQLAEAQGKREMKRSSLPKPLIGQAGEETLQSEDEVSELQQMELHNMDLQVCLPPHVHTITTLKPTH